MPSASGHPTPPTVVQSRGLDDSQNVTDHEPLKTGISSSRGKEQGNQSEDHESNNRIRNSNLSVPSERQPTHRLPVHEQFQAPTRQPREQRTATKPSTLTKKSFTQRLAGQANERRDSKGREELKRTISGPVAVEPPQNLHKPAFDAPVSAVNAGERRAPVRYGQSTMSIPVTPSTTPVDVLRLAAEQLPESVDPKTMILAESYNQLGLERPLRRYEHVRDVLNSWDNDLQNTFMIIPSPTGGKDEDLELDCVPVVQPRDTSVSIYHSQRPGHWNKRWVSLRTDGQVAIAKKDGGESSNICHLSDFDIYIPTARQLSKKIKPPRKICFTVKSQQKSSMFMSTVNFVHFFSTSDKKLAASWYKAVQQWRSWYLVHMMGKGQKEAQSPKKGATTAARRPSADPKSSLDLGARPSIGSLEQRPSRDHCPQRMPIRTRAAPPISFPQELAQDAPLSALITTPDEFAYSQVPPRKQSAPEPFATTGLLGRTYTRRQQAQQAREAQQNPLDHAPAMPPMTRSSEGLKRASSQRQKPKPLVDLTPQYREPPQHSKKGRGVIPSQIPAGGLVEIATSPEAIIDIPPATTWQRPTTSGGRDHQQLPQNEFQRSRTVHRDQSKEPSVNARQASVSPGKAEVPFTNGLLASSGKGQGDARRGRGVMTGDRQARAPMLDLAEPSDYAPGSLLERVERQDGSPRPVVDRTKRREFNAPVGEGL